MSKKFEALVKEAIAADIEYDAHMHKPRLTAQAFVGECLHRGNSDLTKIATLEIAIAERRDFQPGIVAYLRHIEGMIGQGRCSRAPKSYTHMNFPARDEAKSELQAFNGNLFELWALAAQHEAVRHPEVFGTIEDWPAWEAKAAELKSKRDTLFERIGREFDQSDLVIGEVRSDGAALITLKIAQPGMVTLAPQRNVGERLVAYLIAHPAEADRQGPPRRIGGQAY